MVNTDMTAKYITGDYLTHNPTWDIEHSARKAGDILTVISDESLRNLFGSGSGILLEIGCGVGGVVYNFSQKLNARNISHRAVGFDISPAAIERAKEKFGHVVEFHCGINPEMDSNVSLVMLVDVIEHIQNIENFIESAKAYSDHFAIRLPLDNSLWNRVLNKLPELEKRLGHIHYFTYKSALKLIKDNGLEIVDYSFTDNFTDTTNRRTIVSKLMYPVRLITSKISRKANSLLWGGNSIVIFAAKKS